MTSSSNAAPLHAESIRIRGLVQGVGFRPTVWRLARQCDLRGDVRNDGEGVLVRVAGAREAVERFCLLLRQQCPPLARIDALERSPLPEANDWADFRIVASAGGAVHTGVVADAATCPACIGEILDPADRRYRYAFTNCTHCGPRLSIIERIPYDRANTSMAVFELCEQCQQEYRDPADRRFHAQPNACPVCGPQLWLEDGNGQRLPAGEADAIALASRLLAAGHILAIKGIGGFHLACDAENAAAVDELRARKRRFGKPFALMARDSTVIRRHASLDAQGEALLHSPAAPILLLDTLPGERLPESVAPGQRSLGFMLPYSPLHHLLLAEWDRPLVMTSGNRSDEPQCTGNDEARERLRDIADYWLLHDRGIANRVDDSVVRMMAGSPRLLRRARGYAPIPLRLPPGFEGAPPILALGGELKSTFCLLRDGEAILSQHLGDLQEARTVAEYERSLTLYRDLFEHRPALLAADLHPGYHSTRLGRALAGREGLTLVQIQHHFAHVASVLADSGWPLDAGPVIGVALDGLGYGDDGSIWGGEVLLADYQGFRRLACLRPIPMPGGTRAILEPWRNAYSQIASLLGWERFVTEFADLELAAFLQQKPLDVLAAMLERGLNSPLTSSCGRLFDAVAAALGICRDAISYEGQAAIELEALALAAGDAEPGGYGFQVREVAGLLQLDPSPMWRQLLEDLRNATPGPLLAARFHQGLAEAVAGLALRLAREHGIDSVALSGGVFQNRTLFELVVTRLAVAGVRVLSHQQVPTNDGGLALGQAVITAARALSPPG